MAYHITFYYNQPSSKIGGWRENFWSSSASFNAAVNKARALFLVLDAVHGRQASASKFSLRQVADIPIFGGTRLGATLKTGDPAVTIGGVNPDNDADYPSTALQINLSSGGTPLEKHGPHNVTQWIRGLPDINIKNSGRFFPEGAFANKVSALKSFIENPANGIVIRKVNPLSVRYPITKAFVVTGNLEVKGHGVPAATKRLVKISGVDLAPSFNGMKWVTRIDDDNIQISGWEALDSTAEVDVRKAWMRRQEFTTMEISEFEVVESTSHYTGKPVQTMGSKKRRKKS